MYWQFRCREENDFLFLSPDWLETTRKKEWNDDPLTDLSFQVCISELSHGHVMGVIDIFLGYLTEENQNRRSLWRVVVRRRKVIQSEKKVNKKSTNGSNICALYSTVFAPFTLPLDGTSSHYLILLFSLSHELLLISVT
jgi:hypothetical protein